MASDKNPSEPNPDFDWDRLERELTADMQASTGTDAGPDEPETASAVLVDSKDAQTPDRWTPSALRTAQRRPIVPAWARSKAELLNAGRWVVRHYSHIAAYHMLRSPKYGLKLAVRSPRGVIRALSATGRWVSDAEGLPVRLAAVRREDADGYLRLSRQRDNRVRWRTLLLVASLVVGAATVAVFLTLTPPWLHRVVLAGLVGLFGLLGAPADKPLLDTVTTVRRAPKLTSEMVIRALGSLSIAGINQALAKDPKNAIEFAAPITRDGPGWRADINLPSGVTVGEVAERRDKLASALSRPLGCVWPEGNAEVHPGRLVLFVGDEDMSRSRQREWSLLKSGSVDLFRPFAFGSDQRGQLVEVTLMFAAVVIGSIPRIGKTFALRLMLLAAALDVTAELHAYDVKGTGDLSVLEPVAHRYRAGDDEDDIEYAVADLRALQAEMRRRAKVIRDLPRDVCPENKVTRELSSKKGLGLHPIVLAVDECQRWFEHPEHGKELEAISEDLVRRGPALGIITMFATQRPDARSLPTGISSNAVLRFCLKVMGQMENDMVLGTSAYKNGVRATMFSRRDKGIGYLAGEGDDPQITRSFYVDGPRAERVMARARVMREEAGRLSGHALGQAPEPDSRPSYNLLDDLAAVWPDSETAAWNETLCARLAELRPDTYGGWKSEQLTSALKAVKPEPVKVVDVGRRVDGKPVTRRGIRRDDLTTAVTERNRLRGNG